MLIPFPKNMENPVLLTAPSRLFSLAASQGQGAQEKEKQISSAARLGDLRQGRGGRREGKRRFLTYSILNGWGMLHVTPLTQTSPSQALQEALPTGHRNC